VGACAECTCLMDDDPMSGRFRILKGSVSRITLTLVDASVWAVITYNRVNHIRYLTQVKKYKQETSPLNTSEAVPLSLKSGDYNVHVRAW
jgi:hypothetical protein